MSEDEGENNSSFSARKWALFAICCINYAFVHFHRYIPSVLADEIAPELHVSVSKLGVFSSMYFWSYAVMQPFVGCFADVIDLRYIIAVSGVLSSVGSLICGLSHNFILSSFARLLVGIGCACPYVCVNRFMANWFTPKQYTMASSILLCIGGIGGVLSQFPLIYLARAIGWRWALILVAIFGCVFAILALIFVRASPVSFGFKLVEGTVAPHPFVSLKSMLADMWNHICAVVKIYGFWIHSVSVMFSCSCFQNLSSMWAVPFICDVYKYSKSKASTITISLLIVMIVGSPLLGWISYTTGMKKWLNFICQVIGLALTIVFIIWTDSIPLALLVILFFVYGVTTTSTQSFTFPMYKEMVSPECAATVVGCGNMWIFLGAAIVQNITSALLNNTGSSPYSVKAYRVSLWTVSAVQLAVAAIAAALTPYKTEYEEGENVAEKEENNEDGDIPEL